MIIWSGWGVLIPVAAIVGVIAGTFVRVGFALAGYDFGFGVNVIFAAVAVFLFGKFIDRKPDAENRKRANSLFFVPPAGWAVLLVLLGAYSFYEESMSNPGFKRDLSSTTNPTRRTGALEAAETKIISSRNGVAQGRTAKARQCAELFSNTAKELRDAGIEPTNGKSLSLSGGEMITYCEINGDRIAFLVHVPKLRKFTTEAKGFMVEAAWAASQIAASTVDPRPSEVAIGVRGMILYEAAWSGTLVEDLENGDFKSAVTKRVTDQDAAAALLRPYFRRARKKPAPKQDSSASEPTNSENRKEETPEPDVVAATDPPQIPATAASNEAEKSSTSEELSLPTPVREWISTDGTTFTGSLVRFLDEDFQKAEFINEAGKTFRVPISRFADNDAAFLRKYFDSRTRK